MTHSRWSRWFVGRAAAFLLATLGGLCSLARAGGGPETTLLVVNSASPGSQTIANYFKQHGGELADKTVEHLIDELIRFKYVSQTGSKVSYHLV